MLLPFERHQEDTQLFVSKGIADFCPGVVHGIPPAAGLRFSTKEM